MVEYLAFIGAVSIFWLSAGCIYFYVVIPIKYRIGYRRALGMDRKIKLGYFLSFGFEYVRIMREEGLEEQADAVDSFLVVTEKYFNKGHKQ